MLGSKTVCPDFLQLNNVTQSEFAETSHIASAQWMTNCDLLENGIYFGIDVAMEYSSFQSSTSVAILGLG